MGRNKQQATSEYPEDISLSGVRLVREPVGNWPRNPLLITTESLILGWISPEVEEQMEERE